MTVTTAPATTMKAIVQTRLGDAGVLELREVERPVPGPSHVLIRVVSTGLNPTDWGHRRIPGFLGDPAGDPSPRVLGWEVAGVVEQVGLGVAVHRPGDRVFGMLPYPFGVGSAAEYVVVPARSVVPVPDDLDLDVAGAVPLTALTAWQALVDTAGVAPGRRVLIHAAAGGVGHFAVQIAASLGAYVIGTASPANHDLVRRLGADEVLDYSVDGFLDGLEPVDVVLDAVGGAVTVQSLAVTRPGGTIVSLNLLDTPMLGDAAVSAGVRHVPMLVEADHAGMTAVAGLVASGAVTPVIAGRYRLGDIEAVRAAHLRGEAGHVAGKLVLQVP
ncbi:NADP-dependent oxidoreductase [Gordonia iterans]|nr:NADP-dependent oxidoreductase [Gordonia iterans]